MRNHRWTTYEHDFLAAAIRVKHGEMLQDNEIQHLADFLGLRHNIVKCRLRDMLLSKQRPELRWRTAADAKRAINAA